MLFNKCREQWFLIIVSFFSLNNLRVDNLYMGKKITIPCSVLVIYFSHVLPFFKSTIIFLLKPAKFTSKNTRSARLQIRFAMQEFDAFEKSVLGRPALRGTSMRENSHRLFFRK